ncbi:hypothetical protein MBLNU457_1160t1 [Dothideomycetes sp. NU457]
MAQLSQAGKSARERFLIAASERLITSSPTVSARLGSQYLGLVDDDRTKLIDTIQCRGCGSYLIPGWSCKRVTQHSSSKTEKRKIKKPQQSSKETNSKSLFLQCDRCDTRTPIANSRNPQRFKSRASSVQTPKSSDVAAVNDAPPAISTAAASTPTSKTVMSKIEEDSNTTTTAIPSTSKKRARNKKTSGLQALLAQRKADVKGPGLDLMDFMKGT